MQDMQNNEPEPIRFKKRHTSCHLNMYKAPPISKTKSSQSLIPIILFMMRMCLLALTIHLVLVLHSKRSTVMPLAFRFASQCHTFSLITTAAGSLGQNLGKHYKHHKIKVTRSSLIYVGLNKGEHGVKLITFL
jgi:hypothetical protein